MNGQLAKIAKKGASDLAVDAGRDALLGALREDINYIQNLTRHTEEGEFQGALEELAGNSYLMEKIPPSQIVRVAAQATSMGLSVNPLHKECYILPFNVKGRGMVASIVASKKGLQEMAYAEGFFLKIDPVFRIENKPKKESEMDLIELSELDTSDPKFFKQFMLGWYFTLQDVSKDENALDDQSAFVSLKQAMAVTRDMQAPDHSLMQAYVHKAARRAVGQFFIPRKRNQGFDKLVKYDDEASITVEAESVKTETVTPLVGTATVKVVDNKPDAEMEKLMSLIENAGSLDELRLSYHDINNYTGSGNKSVMATAYKAKKAEFSTKEPKKTSAQIMSEINKAKTADEVKAAAISAKHLPDDQAIEIHNASQEKIAQLSA